ncbi:forkhead box protein J3-like, partial [Lytechinus pictus]|uniref:forkhead box protein J3-like n=1 Tax=Lytechinus pictus TaxID=7653 RepID=UPI00240E86E1
VDVGDIITQYKLQLEQSNSSHSLGHQQGAFNSSQGSLSSLNNNQQQQLNQQQQQQVLQQSQQQALQLSLGNSDWLNNLDLLKESVRVASSYNFSDLDLSQFAGLMESMKQADSKNWSLQPEQFADLAESLSNFFQQTGVAGYLNTSRGSGGGSAFSDSPHSSISNSTTGGGGFLMGSPPLLSPNSSHQSLGVPSPIMGHNLSPTMVPQPHQGSSPNMQRVVHHQSVLPRRTTDFPDDDIEDNFPWDTIA